MTHKELLRHYYVEDRDEDLYTLDECYIKAQEIINHMIKVQEETNQILKQYSKKEDKVSKFIKSINILEFF